MTVRIPIVDRRSSRAEESPAPTLCAEPSDGLNEAAVAGSQSQPPASHDAGAAAAAPTPAAPPAGRIEALTAERDEWRDRGMRALAELENLRRVADQRVEFELFGRERDRLARWLELGDALDRARAHAANAPPEWRAGLDDVARLFDKLMAQAEATRIDVSGPFDPAVHEALGVRPDPAKPDGTVVEVSRSGWRLGDRLLRAAGVVVVRNAKA